jgi:hypothetical protein
MKRKRVKAATRVRCTCVDDERSCEEHKFTRADYDRLLAEIKRLRPVVLAAVAYWGACEDKWPAQCEWLRLARAVERMKGGGK